MRIFAELSIQEQDELRLWSERGYVQYWHPSRRRWVQKARKAFCYHMMYRVDPVAVKPRCVQYYTHNSVPHYRVTNTAAMSMRDGFGFTPEEAYGAWLINKDCKRRDL